jgi:hypothetical protein
MIEKFFARLKQFRAIATRPTATFSPPLPFGSIEDKR